MKGRSMSIDDTSDVTTEDVATEDTDTEDVDTDGQGGDFDTDGEN